MFHATLNKLYQLLFRAKHAECIYIDHFIAFLWVFYCFITAGYLLADPGLLLHLYNTF